MLLPSALPCDVRRPSRFAANRLLSTPPPSDDDVPSGNGLLGTCRALQSLLNGSPAPSPRRFKPAPLQSPLDIRSTPSAARSRKLATPSSPKQQTPRPRGPNKRRRDSYEADDDEDADMSDRSASRTRFSTPKRRRHVPYDLPLGLSQSDFYSLHSPPITASPPSPHHQRQQQCSNESSAQPQPQQSYDPDAALPSIEEADETALEPWTADDDQRLVEVVLEKFQLSQRQWDECAQRIGRGHASVGRRWQALVGEGNVGLRRGRRTVRGRIDEMWS